MINVGGLDFSGWESGVRKLLQQMLDKSGNVASGTAGSASVASTSLAPTGAIQNTEQSGVSSLLNQLQQSKEQNKGLFGGGGFLGLGIH